MEITHNLRRDHRIIEQALRGLDGMCLRLARNEAVPPTVLAKAYEFFTAFAEQFHRGKEEKHLLQMLKDQALLSGDATLDSIRHEHSGELQIVNRLGVAIELYRKSGSAESILGLIDAAREYSDFLIAHFEREDNVMFRLVEELLDDASKRDLSDAFKNAERELGPENYKKYQESARELERDWAF